MGSDSAYGEPFYKDLVCPGCGNKLYPIGRLDTNWVGEEQGYVCPDCQVFISLYEIYKGKKAVI